MIYTVTFSPSLDYTVEVDGFEKNKLNRTKTERIMPGGKGVNVSIVLNNMGVKSTALGFIGGFTGKAITDMLSGLGVTQDMIECESGISRINVKVKSDGETEINGQGAVAGEKEVNLLLEKLKAAKSGDVVVLAGNVPATVPSDIYERILSELSDSGAEFVVDATGKLLLGALRYKPLLVKPNSVELGELFGTEIKTDDHIALYAEKLRELGAKNVIVSLGGKGAYLLSESGEGIFSPAPEGKVVDTVGSGDSLVGGFLYEYELSGNVKNAFYRGIATGSASAFRFGLCTKQQSDHQLKCLTEMLK